jgi:hypothetical protein
MKTRLGWPGCPNAGALSPQAVSQGKTNPNKSIIASQYRFLKPPGIIASPRIKYVG